MLKTFWSEMSEIVKANCKELIYVRESAQSPSLRQPGNIYRWLKGDGRRRRTTRRCIFATRWFLSLTENVFDINFNFHFLSSLSAMAFCLFFFLHIFTFTLRLSLPST